MTASCVIDDWTVTIAVLERPAALVAVAVIVGGVAVLRFTVAVNVPSLAIGTSAPFNWNEAIAVSGSVTVPRTVTWARSITAS
ncbi:MAG TPA: hypothetical protein VGJ81_05320 [Thermoanaerobaculia bacterium]